VMGLQALQQLTGLSDRLSAVAVSNAGDACAGVAGTDAVLARLDPVTAGRGLRVYAVKQAWSKATASASNSGSGGDGEQPSDVLYEAEPNELVGWSQPAGDWDLPYRPARNLGYAIELTEHPAEYGMWSVVLSFAGGIENDGYSSMTVAFSADAYTAHVNARDDCGIDASTSLGDGAERLTLRVEVNQDDNHSVRVFLNGDLVADWHRCDDQYTDASVGGTIGLHQGHLPLVLESLRVTAI
jgi:hypothetical protein